MEKVKVLIVEDEIIVARNIQDRLESSGYDVIGCVFTGDEAIKKVKETRPDLVLMEIVLDGDLDGIQAASEIKSICDIPIIYTTAYPKDSTFERLKKSEPYGFVIKPFQMEELHNSIEIALYKHRMEQSLRESEQRYRTLLGNLPVGVFLSTPGGEILSVNAALVKMLGYDSEEEIYASPAWNTYVYPQRRHEMIEQLRQNGSVNDFEAQFWRKDGTSIWVSLCATAEIDDNGNFVCLDGIIENITERKQVEEELGKYRNQLEELVQERTAELLKTNEELTKEVVERKLSEERYKILVDTAGKAGEGILIIQDNNDIEGKIVFANNEIARMLGYSLEELSTKTIRDLLPTSILQDIKALYSQSEVKSIPVHFDTNLIRKDGKILSIEAGVGIITYFGKPAGVAFIEDITERKQAVEALHEVKERYRALYEENPTMYFTVDPTGTVLSVNQFGADQLGYQVSDLVGQSVLKVFHPDDKNAVIEQLSNCVKNCDHLSHWQFRKIRKDGSTLWVRETARAMRSADGSVVVLIVCEDISERITAQKEKLKLQKQLADAEKLVTIGQFTAAITHEINNPLDVILTRLYLVQKSLVESGNDSELWDHVQKIKQQIFRLSHLSRDILDYVKPRSIIFKPVDINAILNNVIESLSAHLTDAITIETQLDAELPLIKGDAIGLELVFNNLLSNAKEAIPGSGKIIVTTGKADKNWLKIMITDTGIGIAETELGKIFEPFYTGKRKTGGTGLGLTICKTIIEEHKGIIRVKSKPGEGTSVSTFLLIQ